MKKVTILLLHTGYWLSYTLLVSFLYVLPLGSEPFPATVADSFQISLAGALAPAIIGFYYFYFQLVPRLLAKRNIRHFLKRGILASVLTGLCLSIIGTLILNYITLSYPLNQFNVMQETAAWRQFWLFMGFSFIAGLNGIVSTVLRGFVTWYLDIRVKENLEKETLKTRLDLLKAQLHPHFLFNTLNNIDMLIQEDPQAASRFLNHLSGMLRFMLYQSSQEHVTLTKELEYIEQYIELQRIRTDNKDFVEFKTAGSNKGLFIAPLLFLPFLENAFKYSTNKQIINAISIEFDIKEDEITFSCRNIYKSSSRKPDTDGGLGLSLVRKRLDLLYRDSHELIIEHTDTVFSVQLRVSLSS